MSKMTKAWLIVAISLILIGCIIFAGVMYMLKWDFSKLTTFKYKTNEHVITEDFRNISINTNTAHILFVLSEDHSCKVVCYEQEKLTHSVGIQDDTLTVNVVDARQWYDHIGINFQSPTITIYLPKAEYASLFIKGSTGDIEMPKDFKFTTADLSLSTGDVKFFASTSDRAIIQTSTGDILAQNLSAGTLDLTVSTGNVTASRISCTGDVKINVLTGQANVTDVTCKNFLSTGSTGYISMKNVIAAEKLTVERSTGAVHFEGTDAGEIYIKTNTGDIRGSLLSEKVFLAKSGTGSVDVPKTVSGGKCEIYTGTGSIKVVIA